MSSVLITKPEMPLFSAPASSGGKPIFFDGFIDDFKLEALLQRFGLHACQEFKIHYSASNVVIATVGPDGGELPFSDGSVTMTIPEGALEHPKLIHCFREVPKAEDLGQLNGPNGKRVLMFSPKFNCGPDGTCFNKPVTLRFRHSFSSRGKDRTGGLKVYTRGGEKTDFDRDETGSFSIDGDWMEIKTNHFSDVAVGEDVDEEHYEDKDIIIIDKFKRASALSVGVIETSMRVSALLEYDVVEELRESARRTSERVSALLDICFERFREAIKRLRKEKKVSAVKRVMEVSFRKTRKQVKVGLKSLKKTKRAIRKRFAIKGKFDLQAIMGDDKRIDILDKRDMDALKESKSLLIKQIPSVLQIMQARYSRNASIAEYWHTYVPMLQVSSNEKQIDTIDGTHKQIDIESNLETEGKFKHRGNQRSRDEHIDILDENDTDAVEDGNKERHEVGQSTHQSQLHMSSAQETKDVSKPPLCSIDDSDNGMRISLTWAKSRGSKQLTDLTPEINVETYGYFYVTPEKSRSDKKGKEDGLTSDIWSFGRLLLETLAGTLFGGTKTPQAKINPNLWQRGRLPQEEFCVFPKKPFSFFF